MIRIRAFSWIAITVALTGVPFDRAAFGEEAAPDRIVNVQGVVRFAGPKPQRHPVALVDKHGEPSDCHSMHKDGLLDENLVVGDGGGLANVFVYIKKGYVKKEYPIPRHAAVVDQDHCMFRPRVQGVMVGQQLLMRNSDPLVHNVRSLSIRNRAFNIAQPADTPDRKKVFKRFERAIEIQCDFHPWMKAYIFVMDHPFFAVTGEDGAFQIDGLPTGEYTIAAWHEQLGEQETSLSVGTEKVADLEFQFAPKQGGRDVVVKAASGDTIKTTGDAASESTPKRRFVRMWKTDELSGDAERLSGRSARRGRAIFDEAGCIKCHVVAGKGTDYGPDLTEVVKRFTGAKLLDQILRPSSEIHKDYQTYAFLTVDGRTIVGLVIKEDDNALQVLPNPLKPKEITVIQKDDIEEKFKSQLSTMPEGLLITFEKEEILDLLAFLQSDK